MEHDACEIQIYDIDYELGKKIRKRGEPLSEDEFRQIKPSVTYDPANYFEQALPAERQEIHHLVDINVSIQDLVAPRYELGEQICHPFSTIVKIVPREDGMGFERQECVSFLCYRRPIVPIR